MGAPRAVVEQRPNLRITDDTGLLWTLSLIDPDAGHQLRRLIGEVYGRDRRWADLIVEQLPPVWAEMYRRGWAA